MAKHLKLFDTHADYETFIETADFIKPNVSHCVAENDVHYNPIQPPTILPENQILWEKFNQIYGENVTNEDFTLFATYPMTYEVYNDSSGEDTYSHWIEINTDFEPCDDNDTANPDYRYLVDLNNQGYSNLFFEDSNNTATIDDFIGMGTTNHVWAPADCGK